MAENTDGESGSPRFGRNLELLAFLLLLTMAHTEWAGYRFGDSNLSVQVPLVKHFADRELYPGDPLLLTSKGYASFFFPAIGLLVRSLGGLEVIYFALFLAGKFLGLWARWSLSRLIFDDRQSAVLLLFLCLGACRVAPS